VDVEEAEGDGEEDSVGEERSVFVCSWVGDACGECEFCAGPGF
jgi:hypothetical protein